MFTVRWKRSALNELAGLWTQADSALRQAITAATHQIDQGLQRDPDGSGESRGDGGRIWFVFPLGIRFEGITHSGLFTSYKSGATSDVDKSPALEGSRRWPELPTKRMPN